VLKALRLRDAAAVGRCKALLAKLHGQLSHPDSSGGGGGGGALIWTPRAAFRDFPAAEAQREQLLAGASGVRASVCV